MWHSSRHRTVGERQFAAGSLLTLSNSKGCGSQIEEAGGVDSLVLLVRSYIAKMEGDQDWLGTLTEV